MKIHEQLDNMLREFTNLNEVDAILIAGSRTTNTVDAGSDYDIYIYVNKEIPVSTRESVTSRYCSYMEINNQFWEAEDDGYLKEDNVPVEIIYRDLSWLDSTLQRTLLHFGADTGYTTCFWANLLTSFIYFDRNGSAKRLQDKYNIAYPEQLKLNIVNKNYPLLKKQMPAYYHQIEKAIRRSDFVSINHRTAALLASYFDILFAVNELPHPGEKKILKILSDRASKLPKDINTNILNILSYTASASDKLLTEIDELLDNLDDLLVKENIPH